MGKKKGSELISAGRSHPRFSMMANSLGLRQLLPLILCWAPVLAQRNCELCVTVSGDPTDPLVGIYRKLENDALCEEYGCSYTKDGSPDEVYCFKDGDYQAEAGEECPTEGTAPTGSTSSTEAVTASVLSSPESVEESIATVRSQSAELTTDLIDQVRDLDADTATKLEELKAKLDDLSDTLEEYKLEISSRRRRQADDSCNSLSQQLDKLVTLRTETEELISLADTILELTILPNDVRTLIDTFKDYHENHLEEINAEESAKNSDYSADCGSTTGDGSTDGNSDGETSPGTTGGSTVNGESSSSGGFAVSGGSSSTGGSTVSGGSSSIEGSTISGGSSSTGGSTVSGESTTTGGSTVSGGSSSTGGSTVSGESTTVSGGSSSTEGSTVSGESSTGG